VHSSKLLDFFGEMETSLSTSEVAREEPNMEMKDYTNMVNWSPVVKQKSFVHKATMCFDSFSIGDDVDNIKSVKLVQSLLNGRMFLCVKDLCCEIFRDLCNNKLVRSQIDDGLSSLGVMYKPYLDRTIERGTVKECSVYLQYWDGFKQTVVAMEWCHAFLEYFFEMAVVCGFFDKRVSDFNVKKEHARLRLKHFQNIVEKFVECNRVVVVDANPFSLEKARENLRVKASDIGGNGAVETHVKAGEIDSTVLEKAKKVMSVENSAVGLNGQAATVECNKSKVDIKACDDLIMQKNQKRNEERKRKREEYIESVRKFSKGLYSHAKRGGVCPFKPRASIFKQ